jgi:DNA-binding transcriptional ArsR family regulator
LRDVGLVVARRDGKWVHYSLDIGRLNHLTDLYKQVILGGFDENQNIGTGMCKLQEA